MTQHALEITHDTEIDWLAFRMAGIGASEIPTILGINKWESPFSLYQKKIGAVPPDPVNLAMRLGHMLEPVVAELYEDETGYELIDPGEYTTYTHPDHPWLFCTPDRIRLLTTPVANDWIPVELKTVGLYNAKDFGDTDGCWTGPHYTQPDPSSPGRGKIEHQAQLMGQIFILGAEFGTLAALVGNRSFHHFDFERNDRLIKAMLPKLKEFLERVQNQDPPDVDAHPATTETLKLMHPMDDDSTTALSLAAIDAMGNRATVKLLIVDAEKRLELYENTLRDCIGSATFAKSDIHILSYKHRTRKGTIKVDYEHAAALEAAGIPHDVKEPTTYRQFGAVKEVE